MQLLKVRGERLKFVSELFGAMKVVKMYAWEKSLRDNVDANRERELNVLKRVIWWGFGMMLCFWVHHIHLIG